MVARGGDGDVSEGADEVALRRRQCRRVVTDDEIGVPRVGLEKSPPGGKLAGMDHGPRRQDVEARRQPVLRDHEELGLVVELAVDLAQGANQRAVRMEAREGVIPGFHLGKEEPVGAAEVRLHRLDQLVAETVDGALEVLAALQEHGELTLVAKKIAAGSLALDEDRARRAGARERPRLSLTPAALGELVEIAGDVDAVAGDGTGDLEGRGGAAVEEEEVQGEALEVGV